MGILMRKYGGCDDEVVHGTNSCKSLTNVIMISFTVGPIVSNIKSFFSINLFPTLALGSPISNERSNELSLTF